MNLFTLEETAKELGLQYSTVKLYVYCGKIKAVKVGKRRMVSPEEIYRFKNKKGGEL